MNFPSPEFQNSAGRLLAVMRAIKSDQAYVQQLPSIAGFNNPNGKASRKSEPEQLKLVNEILDELRALHGEFIADVNVYVPEFQRQIVVEGLSKLPAMLYPKSLVNAGGIVLGDGEIAILKMAAVSIPFEDVLPETDREAIRVSLNTLHATLADSDIAPQARKILQDLIRITENALRFYEIHGARALRKAVKQMLGETMELYSDVPESADKPKLISAVFEHLKTIERIAARLMTYRPVLSYAGKTLLRLATTDGADESESVEAS